MFENAEPAKESNQERIFALLRKRGSLTRQEIAAALQLSMPTALQNVSEMMERGILEEGGAAESTGGRRAKKIRLNGRAGCLAGIDIGTADVGIVLTDLMGTALAKKIFPLEFRDDPEVYGRIASELESLLKKHRLKSKVLGAGISFPGIVDMEAGWIVKSHIFRLDYVSLDRFRRAIPYPIVVENDANCMSFAELAGGQTDYVYLSLNRTVGGSVVWKGSLVKGEGFRTGEIGHMILVPGGRTCYCGKKGCADAYLSPHVLLREYKTLGEFFAALESGKKETAEAWRRYLDYLAAAVTNLRMILDMKIIIGGEVGAYMGSHMGELCAKAAEYDWFARDIDYLVPCKQTEMAGAFGAAFLATEKYGHEILRESRQAT